MPLLTAQILPLLAWLATSGGAGLAASLLFDLARRRWPAPAAAALGAAPRPLQALYAALHAPAYARLAVFALAALLSVLASAAVAALSGEPVLAAADAAAAIVVSQLLHARRLPTAPAAPAAAPPAEESPADARA